MSRKGWLLFCALCVIWGIPYLLIRIAVRELTPATLVFLRTAPVAVLMAPFALRRGRLRPLLARWRWVVGYTLVEIAGELVPMALEMKRMAPTETNTWIFEALGTDRGVSPGMYFVRLSQGGRTLTTKAVVVSVAR